MSRRPRVVLFAIIAFGFFLAPARAQVAQAELRGSVVDETGGLGKCSRTKNNSAGVVHSSRRERSKLLTSASCALSAEANEDDLGEGRHKLSPVFHAAHAVISAVRESTTSS